MLDIRNLTVAFDSRRGRLTAVKSVDLSVSRGEILGVVGESGAGKSTVGAAVMGLRSIFMPALTLTIFNVGLFIRLVRAEVLETRTTDYIKFARARGLPERRINRRHVLPNAVMPVINVAALNIGIMLAFSLITEAVFQWPGVGLMFLQSIRFSDFPVMSAYFMLVAVMFVSLNLLADVLLAIVDPRIRRGEN